MDVPLRKRNPFTSSASGGRALSALQLPFFALRPPAGFGVLTTTGRRTGKRRRKCVRAIRRGDRAFLVAIKGSTAWSKNALANPAVRLKIRGGTFTGRARPLKDPAERQEAREAYCETVNPFDYPACALWRRGRPTRATIKELHGSWFEQGLPLVVELEGREG